MAGIIDKVQQYLERTNVQTELCRVYLRKIEHLYYKFDPRVLQQKAVSWFNIFFNFMLLEILSFVVLTLARVCKFHMMQMPNSFSFVFLADFHYFTDFNIVR